MRRFLLLFVAAHLLGVGPLPVADSQAWAQGRGKRVVRLKGKASKKARVPPKKGAPPDEAEGEQSDLLGAEPAAATSSAAPPTRGPTRLDFDDRLIQGQTNKSGSVYLYDRKELKTRSMLRERESFRSETLSTVYDQ